MAPIPTPKSSLMTPGQAKAIVPRSTLITNSSSPVRSLSTVAIVGISVGAVVGLAVLMSIPFFILRSRCRRSLHRKLSSCASDKKGQRERGRGRGRSGSSDSLTSFDARTEDGLDNMQQAEQDQLLHGYGTSPFSKHMPLSIISYLNCSPNSPTQTSAPAVPPKDDAPKTDKRDTAEPGQSFELKRFSSQSPYLTTRNSHRRSRSSSSLPSLINSMYDRPSHSRSTSEISLRYQYHRLSPILDSPPLPTPNESASITPAYGTPMVSACPTPDRSIRSPPLTRDKSRIPRSKLRSTTVPPLTIKTSFSRGASPVSRRPTAIVASYLDSKPLPPSPVGPPAPPPPFPPPLPPQKKRRLHHDAPRGVIKAGVSMTSKYAKPLPPSRPYVPSTTQGYLPLSKHTNHNSISAFPVNLHDEASGGFHISSLAKGSEPVLSLSSPKPVLKLEVNHHNSCPLPELPTFPLTPALRPTTTPSPVSDIRSTPASFLSRYMNSARNSPYLTLTEAESAVDIDQCAERPISTAATVASTSPALSASSGDSEVGDEVPLTPRLANDTATYRSLQEPSITVTSVIEEYTEPRSPPPLLNIRTKSTTTASKRTSQDQDHEQDPKPIRSPSISVPIVFRFSFPKRKLSRKKAVA